MGVTPAGPTRGEPCYQSRETGNRPWTFKGRVVHLFTSEAAKNLGKSLWHGTLAVVCGLAAAFFLSFAVSMGFIALKSLFTGNIAFSINFVVVSIASGSLAKFLANIAVNEGRQCIKHAKISYYLNKLDN